MIRPPLTTSMTVPSTTSSFSFFCSIVPQARSYCARFLDRISRPSLSSFWRTRASIWSPTRHDLVGVDVVLDRKFTGGDDTLGLVADVQQDLVAVDLDDRALDDVAIVEVLDRGVDSGQEVVGVADVVDCDLRSCRGLHGGRHVGVDSKARNGATEGPSPVNVPIPATSPSSYPGTTEVPDVHDDRGLHHEAARRPDNAPTRLPIRGVQGQRGPGRRCHHGAREPVVQPWAPPMNEAIGVGRRPADADASARANRRWWDADADAYHAEHGAFLGDVRLRLVPGAAARRGRPPARRRSPGGRILEVGCGSAMCSRWLLGQGARPVAFDLSAGMLAHARSGAAATGLAVPLVQADAQHLPFADRSLRRGLHRVRRGPVRGRLGRGHARGGAGAAARAAGGSSR